MPACMLLHLASWEKWKIKYCSVWKGWLGDQAHIMKGIWCGQWGCNCPRVIVSSSWIVTVRNYSDNKIPVRGLAETPLFVHVYTGGCQIYSQSAISENPKSYILPTVHKNTMILYSLIWGIKHPPLPPLQFFEYYLLSCHAGSVQHIVE